MSKTKSPSRDTTPSVKAFHRLVMRHALGHASEVVQRHDLTLPQLGTLIKLQMRGAMSVSAVADAGNLSLAAGSHMVNRLVEAGFVERAEDPDDRRQKRVTLSERGRAFLRDFDEAREITVRELFQNVPDAVLDRLEGALAEALEHVSVAQPGRSARRKE